MFFFFRYPIQMFFYYYILDKVVVCLQCATIFEDSQEINSRLRNQHSIRTCRGLRYVKQAAAATAAAVCPMHSNQSMLKGDICTLCRPNVKILGLTRKEIQSLSGDTPNYIFLYGVHNTQPYKYNGLPVDTRNVDYNNTTTRSNNNNNGDDEDTAAAATAATTATTATAASL